VLAVPILALVKDSTDVYYFVLAIAIFLQNFTVVVLLFGPKIHKTFLGEGDPNQTTGGNWSLAAGSNHSRTFLHRAPARRSHVVAESIELIAQNVSAETVSAIEAEPASLEKRTAGEVTESTERRGLSSEEFSSSNPAGPALVSCLALPRDTEARP
jgi:hypothetical protein